MTFKPGQITWGNCWLAWFIYWRDGGHLIISRSTGHAVIPHVSWAAALPSVEVIHLLPIVRRYGWRALFASIFFKGKWVKQTIGRRQGEITL